MTAHKDTFATSAAPSPLNTAPTVIDFPTTQFLSLGDTTFTLTGAISEHGPISTYLDISPALDDVRVDVRAMRLCERAIEQALANLRAIIAEAATQ